MTGRAATGAGQSMGRDELLKLLVGVVDDE